MSNKRALATITFYVYSNYDDDPQRGQYLEAKKVCDEINKKYDCLSSIESIHTAEYGVVSESKKINLKKYM